MYIYFAYYFAYSSRMINSLIVAKVRLHFVCVVKDQKKYSRKGHNYKGCHVSKEIPGL